MSSASCIPENISKHVERVQNSRQVALLANPAKFPSLLPVVYHESDEYSSYTALMNDTERVEDKPSSIGSPVAMAQTPQGEGLNTRNTSTSSSNTRSPTPSYTSCNASDLRQQSLMASDTSANSHPLLHPPNAAIGLASVYTPNIDLLHIGAKFSLDFVDDYGHINIGTDEDLDMVRTA